MWEPFIQLIIVYYSVFLQDFPSKGWLIRFSDVIGASHTGDYRFWSLHGNASIGLRQVAEFGATRKLESELKDRVRSAIYMQLYITCSLKEKLHKVFNSLCPISESLR